MRSEATAAAYSPRNRPVTVRNNQSATGCFRVMAKETKPTPHTTFQAYFLLTDFLENKSTPSSLLPLTETNKSYQEHSNVQYVTLAQKFQVLSALIS